MSVAVEDFWKTVKGLTARLSDLAHHLTWASVNTAIREQVAVIEDDYQTTTGEPSGQKLSWKTVGDVAGYESEGDEHGVCEICEDNEGEYDPTEDVLPYMPAHVMCRCWWEIIEGD